MAKKELSITQDLLFEETNKKNVIPIKKEFISICDGSPSAAIMLHQLVYWTDRASRNSGWIYKSAPQWYDETCLTVRRLETARSKLVELGFITTDKKVAEGHYCYWYKVNVDNVQNALEKLKDESNVATCEMQVMVDGTQVAKCIS